MIQLQIPALRLIKNNLSGKIECLLYLSDYFMRVTSGCGKVYQDLGGGKKGKVRLTSDFLVILMKVLILQDVSEDYLEQGEGW